MALGVGAGTTLDNGFALGAGADHLYHRRNHREVTEMSDEPARSIREFLKFWDEVLSTSRRSLPSIAFVSIRKRLKRLSTPKSSGWSRALRCILERRC